MATIADSYRREALAEGLARGKAEGQSLMLLRMLERRFGPLPEASRQQVMRASGAQIDAWADALLEASSLDAVFAVTRH